MARLAVLSYHTSPLAQPGTGDGGGMNVYVRELGASLARLGHEVDVYTRRDAPGPAVVTVEPGLTVRRVAAGPAAALTRDEFERFVPDFTAAVAADLEERGAPDAIHAHYWLSAIAGHQLKHDLGVPLIVTFHTLERVKAEALDAFSEHRAAQEAAALACADAVLASCDVEAEQFVRLYGADPARVHVVPLGVEHAFFGPGPRAEARRALGLDAESTTLLYVGRIQELKGADLALETLVELRARGRDARLVVVGGPSGSDGRATLSALHQRVAAARVIADVAFVAPQAHQLLGSFMRAADVTLVPSRSESFGLVALESSACGTPVVASAVGGLTTLVTPGVNGELLLSRDPVAWADAVEWATDPSRAGELSAAAARLAAPYTWRAAAQRLAELVEELAAAALVRC